MFLFDPKYCLHHYTLCILKVKYNTNISVGVKKESFIVYVNVIKHVFFKYNFI